MDGERRPLRSKRQVNFCHLWRLGLESHVSMRRTALLAGLGNYGTRSCLSQANTSKSTGQLAQRVPGSLGLPRCEEGWEPRLQTLELGVDQSRTLLGLQLSGPSCLCQVPLLTTALLVAGLHVTALEGRN